jgi:hypothetical protein
MHNGLQIISFPWIFRIEKLHVLFKEFSAYRPSHNFTGDIRTHHKLQKEFIHQLKMRPSFLKMGLVLIWVNLLLLFIVCTQISEIRILTLILESPKNVFLDHCNAFTQNVLVEKLVVSIIVVQNVNKFNQHLFLLVPEFDLLGIFL